MRAFVANRGRVDLRGADQSLVELELDPPGGVPGSVGIFWLRLVVCAWAMSANFRARESRLMAISRRSAAERSAQVSHHTRVTGLRLRV